MPTTAFRRGATRTGLIAGAVIASFALASCAGPAEETTTAAPAAGSVDLAAAGCPADIKIQTDWNPEAEHGHLYSLFDVEGGDYTIDSGVKSVTGPLTLDGEPTGVDVTVLAGGPATGFTQPNAQMYSDESIFMAYVGTDEAIANWEQLPTVGVFAPLEKDPQMLMWDPETFPDVQGIADFAAEGMPVVVFPGGTYIDYFVGIGYINADQVDATYDGSPARWVAEDGAIVQQGFASAEPYIYLNEVPEWGKEVSYQLINDAGYPKYAAMMSVRPEHVTEYADCLAELVPVLQQAEVNYYTDETFQADVNSLILELVDAYDTGWIYGPEVAEFSVETQLADGLVSDGPDSTLGNFDEARVAELFDIVGPIFAEQGIEVPEDLTAEMLYTNDFVDPAISLGQ